MMHKKGKFLNFCFSCIPGAGQMYQGFMKRGVSIMTIFFGILTLISFSQLDELIFCLPIIWFYGFFDGIHRNSLPDFEYVQLKDDFLFINEEIKPLQLKKFRIPVAVLFIFFGAYSLIKLIIYMLISNDFLFWDSPIVRMIDTFFPQTIFSVLIILLGVYLIIGKKKEMEQENFEENAFFYEKDNSPAEEYPESLLMQSEKDIMNQENFKTAESASEKTEENMDWGENN